MNVRPQPWKIHMSPLSSLYSAHLSPDELVFLKDVADFAVREVAPHAEMWEKNEELPRAVFEAAGKIGLLGVTVPKALGGRGHGYVAYSLAIRELSRYQAALAIDIAAHNALGTGHILKF